MYEPMKAVDVRDPAKLVYARFYSDECELCGPFPGGLYFRTPIWIVWHPEVVEYETMQPEAFDERYVLECNAPPAVQDKLKLYPSYEEWCDMADGKQEVLQ